MPCPARCASVLLLVALLPACEILSPPDGELVLMVSTGYFDVLEDTVTIQHGQGLKFRWNRSSNPPDPPEILPVLYVDVDPEVFLSVRGERSGPDAYLWQNEENCDDATDWQRRYAEYRGVPPDRKTTIMPLTDELRATAKRILPCAEEINPEAALVRGAFRECAAGHLVSRR